MLTVDEAKHIIENSALDVATLNKLICAVDAINHGVHRAHIVDGSIEHSVLLEFFTVFGIGTAIVSNEKELYIHEKDYLIWLLIIMKLENNLWKILKAEKRPLMLKCLLMIIIKL